MIPNNIKGHSRGSMTGFVFNSAIKFDGVNDIVTIPNQTSDLKWTLSYWFKWDGTQTGIGIGSPSGVHYAHYLGTNVKDKIYVRLSGTNIFKFPTTNADNNWHHCLLVNDSTVGMRLYRDAVESASGLLTATNGQAWTLSRLGQRNGTLKYKGELDDVLYKPNYIGTLQDAIDIYNLGEGANAMDVLGANTFYSHLDGAGADTTAVDLSGNGNDGTLINGPVWVDHITGIPV